MKTPIYIVGPCSAESREQVIATAGAIADRFAVRPASPVGPLHCKTGDESPVRWIFRAGVWKPRTSPNTFQGAGEEALAWLREVKETYGMPVATEVATPEHVEAALQAGIDYLWIGARSSANPIVVQSIAEQIKNEKLKIKNSLQGVLIKNPVNADAELWLGNIERLEKTGLPVMAVHRGCNHQPCWAMAHKVRQARPDIPMLLDPSHMSGDAAQVPVLMEKIEELGLDGAMIEVHCDPEHALSDNAQQLTPLQLANTLDPIASRLRLVSVFSTTDSPEELNWLRAEIDELDERLWDTIAARMDVSKRIGAWKKAHGVAPLQPERAKVIRERIKEKGEWALRIWEQIHQESLKQQE